MFSGKPRGKFAIVKVTETSIPPRENVTYSKETQTINTDPHEKEGRCASDYIVIYYIGEISICMSDVRHMI